MNFFLQVLGDLTKYIDKRFKKIEKRVGKVEKAAGIEPTA